MSDVLADAKTRLVLSDQWRAASGVWPTTAPPDGAYEGLSYDEIRDLVRALVERVEQAEGCDGHCGCVVLSRHAWREAYSKERLQREQAEREEAYRMQTTEAAYQEAQVTIAGLEAERDHYRGQCAQVSEDRDQFSTALLEEEARAADYRNRLFKITAEQDSLFEQAMALGRGIGTWADLVEALVSMWLTERRKVANYQDLLDHVPRRLDSHCLGKERER